MNQEQKEAFEKYGNFHSTHEVFGVLLEEVEEFWQIVKEKPNTNLKKERMISELTDIINVAERAKIELQNNLIKHV